MSFSRASIAVLIEASASAPPCEYLRRVIHLAQRHERGPELGRVSGLLPIVRRPHRFGRPFRCVVSNGALRVFHIARVQQVRGEEARFDDRDLDAELADFLRDR